jgi:hypothetical protein
VSIHHQDRRLLKSTSRETSSEVGGVCGSAEQGSTLLRLLHCTAGRKHRAPCNAETLTDDKEFAGEHLRLELQLRTLPSHTTTSEQHFTSRTEVPTNKDCPANAWRVSVGRREELVSSARHIPGRTKAGWFPLFLENCMCQVRPVNVVHSKTDLVKTKTSQFRRMLL